MSHFPVAVFHYEDQHVSDLLAPYNEKITVEPYIEYTRQEAINHAKECYGYDTESWTDNECWSFIARNYASGMIDEEGNLYSTRNPKAKWDWWKVGGRCVNALEKYDGTYTNEGRVKDIEFHFSWDLYIKACEYWDTHVEGVELASNKTSNGIHSYFENKEDFYRVYKNRRNFAEYKARFIPYACITPDGEWHSPGRVGWFGLSSESEIERFNWKSTFIENFMTDVDNDLYITIVDCHI